MRKRRIYVIGALALAACVAVAGIAYAATANQSLEIGVTPNKLPKKKFKKKVDLNNIVDTFDEEDPDAVPPDADQSTLFFDNDFKFDTTGIPTCDRGSIENTTTQQAKSTCGKAQVGAGDAVIALQTPSGPLDVDAVVTAFNGEPAGGGSKATAAGSGGKPTILLHARVDDLSTTVILEGTLSKIKKGDFGWKLVIPIEDIAGGSGGIRQFQTEVGKSFVDEKYVTARCKDKNKRLDAQIKTVYSDSPSTKAKANQKCKPKG